MEYFIILVILLVLGLVLEKVYGFHLYQSRRERLEITGLFFVVGVIWDSFAIIRGHWYFGDEFLLFDGLYIGVMPLEEYLFILIVPYWILTSYTVLDMKLREGT